MNRQYLWLAAVVGVAASAPALLGQVIPPFYGNGAIAYQPEIAVVNSGILNDMQGTVSPDLRYVTINAQPQQSNLLALREFSFGQQTQLGVVGIGAQQRGPNGQLLPLVQGGQYGVMNPPVLVGAGAGLALRQRGMTPLVHSPGK